MPELSRSVDEITTFLRGHCGLHQFTVDPRLMAVPFDAMLGGADPLMLVAVEHKQRLSPRTIDEVVRKAQTFVWTAYSNDKLALLNLVLLLPQTLPAEQQREMEKQLSGVARIFVVTESMPMYEVEARLTPLAMPSLEVGGPVELGANVATMLAEHEASFYDAVTRESATVEEIKNKIVKRFSSLAAEVTRATENT